jgi:hypothetical protein
VVSFLIQELETPVPLCSFYAALSYGKREITLQILCFADGLHCYVMSDRKKCYRCGCLTCSSLHRYLIRLFSNGVPAYELSWNPSTPHSYLAHGFSSHLSTSSEHSQDHRGVSILESGWSSWLLTCRYRAFC